MDILKRLFQVLLWVTFPLTALILVYYVGGFIESGYPDEEIIFYTSILVPSYCLIVIIRWILFKEWIFLPWKKASTKED